MPIRTACYTGMIAYRLRGRDTSVSFGRCLTLPRCPLGRPLTQRLLPKSFYFGTPVALLSTENEDGTFNLAPMSSAWALGSVVVLGLGREGQTAHNLAARTDLVINLPSPSQWPEVERLAPLTGRATVPATPAWAYRLW
jgi:hypothetical protein